MLDHTVGKGSIANASPGIISLKKSTQEFDVVQNNQTNNSYKKLIIWKAVGFFVKTLIMCQTKINLTNKNLI